MMYKWVGESVKPSSIDLHPLPPGRCAYEPCLDKQDKKTTDEAARLMRNTMLVHSEIHV